MPEKKSAPKGAAGSIFSEVTAGRFRPLYLFYDSEPFFVDEFVRLLKKKLLIPGLEVFNFEKLDAGDIRSEGLTVGAVESRVRGIPVGAERRLMVIEHLEEMRRDALEKLCAVLARVPDTTTVVASCEYETGFEEVFKKTGVERFVLRLRAPEGEELKGLLKSWGKAAGLEFDERALETLVEISGSDLRFLKGEMEKLATVLEPGQKITVEVVERYASSTRVFELSELLRLVRERNLSGALKMLRRLEAKGEEPVRIVVSVGYALLNLLRDLSRGRSGTHRWSAAALQRAIDAIYEIDRRIVSGHPEPFALIDLWLVWALGGSRSTKSRVPASVSLKGGAKSYE
ncbi:MAG: DNA polymerase III subunit delta [bacterium]